MGFNHIEFSDDQDDRSKQQAGGKHNAYRVDDENDLEEKDLETGLTGGTAQAKPVLEGQAMGGQNFGQDSRTTGANDKNNPQQNAGTTNPYFNRTEPSEEHPEDSNFTAQHQQGQPNYNKAQPYSKAQPDLAVKNEDPKPEEPRRGNGENDRPHPQQPYQEGTADNEDGNIPGPEELPDQQKVGEDVDDNTYEKDHIET